MERVHGAILSGAFTRHLVPPPSGPYAKQELLAFARDPTELDRRRHDALYNLVAALDSPEIHRRRDMNHGYLVRMLVAPSNFYRDTLLEVVTETSMTCTATDIERCTVICGRILALSVSTVEDRAILGTLETRTSDTGDPSIVLKDNDQRNGIVAFLARVHTHLDNHPSIRPSGSAFAHLHGLLRPAITDLTNLTWPDDEVLHFTGAKSDRISNWELGIKLLVGVIGLLSFGASGWTLGGNILGKETPTDVLAKHVYSHAFNVVAYGPRWFEYPVLDLEDVEQEPTLLALQINNVLDDWEETVKSVWNATGDLEADKKLERETKESELDAQAQIEPSDAQSDGYVYQVYKWAKERYYETVPTMSYFEHQRQQIISDRLSEDIQFAVLILASNMREDSKLDNVQLPRGADIVGDNTMIQTSKKNQAPSNENFGSRSGYIKARTAQVMKKLFGDEADIVSEQFKLLVDRLRTLLLNKPNTSPDGVYDPLQVAWHEEIDKHQRNVTATAIVNVTKGGTNDTPASTPFIPSKKLQTLFLDRVRQIAYRLDIVPRPTFQQLEWKLSINLMHLCNPLSSTFIGTNVLIGIFMMKSLLYTVDAGTEINSRLRLEWSEWGIKNKALFRALNQKTTLALDARVFLQRTEGSDTSADVERLLLMRDHLVMPMLRPVDTTKPVFPWYAVDIPIDETYRYVKTIKSAVIESTGSATISDINNLAKVQAWNPSAKRLTSDQRAMAKCLFAPVGSVLEVLSPRDSKFETLLSQLIGTSSRKPLEETLTRILSIKGFYPVKPVASMDTDFGDIMFSMELCTRQGLDRIKSGYSLKQTVFWSRRRHALAWLCLVCVNLSIAEVKVEETNQARQLIQDVTRPLLNAFTMNKASNVLMQVDANEKMEAFFLDDSHPLRFFVMDMFKVHRTEKPVEYTKRDTLLVVQLVWALEAVVRKVEEPYVNESDMYEWDGKDCSDY